MSVRRHPWYLATWLLLVVLAVLTILFPVLDLVGITRSGLPSDHEAAYRALAGQAFPGVHASGVARYIRQLELGYALHELTFALFFLVIVAIPFRGGRRWAWWACWISLIATVGYAVTFARYSSTTLAYSLVPVVGIPLLLLAQAPRFFGNRAHPASSARQAT